MVVAPAADDRVVTTNELGARHDLTFFSLLVRSRPIALSRGLWSNCQARKAIIILGVKNGYRCARAYCCNADRISDANATPEHSNSAAEMIVGSSAPFTLIQTSSRARFPASVSLTDTSSIFPHSINSRKELAQTLLVVISLRWATSRLTSINGNRSIACCSVSSTRYSAKDIYSDLVFGYFAKLREGKSCPV